MDLITTPAFIFCLCTVVCIVLCHAIWRWRENRNNERVTPGFKLLRGPGESLQRQIAAIDDKLFSWLLNILGLPLIMLASTAGAYLLSGKTAFDGFVAILIQYVLPLVFIWTLYSTICLLRLLSKRRNLYLGYFGERIVSENLDPLRAKGACVFHDVPVSAEQGRVNIDHVVICPAGVFAIETKTRRKGPVREGRADGKIIYDGAQLAYPWGEDTFGISQAANNALWLEKTIAKTGNPNVPVHAILTFPGWRIELADSAANSVVCVLTPAQIPLHLETLPPKLTANQVKQLAQHLETLCRDVEF
ncbi:nuclease-related domain-containing protein [Ereboglobus luteus]|uniref:NERD domain-containing protein n=1 Tax=Ereboglobus luteus TaxID=1796921 RepID=A0A2U8E1V9_9BACT|nr:nuclease-related domain-containing protein [Ereboglobus luteus]AWI08821.1 hypothetical protein CKA38_05735 [Ereboglobus luteus]